MSASLATLALLVAGQTPYVRSHVGNDPEADCLWWQAGTVTLSAAASGIPETSGDSEHQALQRSLQTWGQAMEACGNLQLVQGAASERSEIGFDRNNLAANRNTLVFRQANCTAVAPEADTCWAEEACGNKYNCWDDARYGAFVLALTTTTYDIRTGRLYDADIELNDANFYFTTADGPVCGEVESQACAATDVENTLTHELGHLLGLDHAQATASTMFPSAERGEISKRVLDPGTRQFVCDVYPKGAASRNCEPPPKPVEPKPEPDEGCSATGGGPLLAALALLLRPWRRRRG
jgi:hypothetical protein